MLDRTTTTITSAATQYSIIQFYNFYDSLEIGCDMTEPNGQGCYAVSAAFQEFDFNWSLEKQSFFFLIRDNETDKDYFYLLPQQSGFQITQADFHRYLQQAISEGFVLAR